MAYYAVVLSTILLTFLFLPIKLVHSQEPFTNCSITQDSYAPNSTFHQNLKIVLTNLTFAPSTTRSSFYNSSYGQKKDRVYGLHLCRGDLKPENCSLCIGNLTQSILTDCPSKKEAIKWAPECMLRYANRNIFSRKEDSPWKPWTPVALLSATPPAPPMSAFNLTKVLEDLSKETAFGNYSSQTTARFFATRRDNITGTSPTLKLYSLAQCTPDISPSLCHDCLTQAYKKLSICCTTSIQAIAYLPSCQLRYGDEKFSYIDDGNSPTSPPPSISQPPPKGPDHRYIPIVIAASSAVAILLLSGLCFVLWKWYVKPSSNYENEIITTESLQYDINTIKDATNNFSADRKLGQGGFGEVYKGTLQSGQEIAVKRLSPNSRQGIHEFKTEVLLVAKLQHKNLARLVGFCVTEEENLLVYEYLPYLSLDRLLFDPGKRPSLVWETRYKIIDGIAKGLLYLHEDSRYKIVHRDLKPSNILLDKDMTPKISDFGMAKLYGEYEVQDISNRIVGTHGYMAPEYIRSGQLSFKSDVYSFGVLVLEIVSGQRIRNRFIHTSEHEEGLIQRAWRSWNAKEPQAFVDSTLCGNFSAEEARQCIYIGLSCIQEDADNRPTMASIVSMLNSYSNTIPKLSPDGYSKSDDCISPGLLDQSTNTYSGMEDITALIAR